MLGRQETAEAFEDGGEEGGRAGCEGGGGGQGFAEEDEKALVSRSPTRQGLCLCSHRRRSPGHTH